MKQIAAIMFFYSVYTIGFASEWNAVLKWHQDQFGAREIRSAIVEYETDFSNTGRQHRFLVFDYPRVYEWSQKIPRENEIPENSEPPEMRWWDGGLLVVKSDLPQSDFSVRRKVDFSDDQWRVVFGSTVNNLLCVEWISLKALEHAKQISETGEDLLRYELSFPAQKKKWICEFQGIGEPFLLAQYYVTEEGHMTSRTDYKDWFFSHGMYFPKEVIMTRFDLSSTGMTNPPEVYSWKTLNLYSVNEYIHAAWFIPAVGQFDVGTEIWAPEQDESFTLRDVRRVEDMLMKYGQFMPSSYWSK